MKLTECMHILVEECLDDSNTVPETQLQITQPYEQVQLLYKNSCCRGARPLEHVLSQSKLRLPNVVCYIVIWLSSAHTSQKTQTESPPSEYSACQQKLVMTTPDWSRQPRDQYQKVKVNVIRDVFFCPTWRLTYGDVRQGLISSLATRGRIDWSLFRLTKMAATPGGGPARVTHNDHMTDPGVKWWVLTCALGRGGCVCHARTDKFLHWTHCSCSSLKECTLLGRGVRMY